MELADGIKRIKGTVEVEVEGFFTERFINLCKINNIKIWDIRNIVSGIVRFHLSIKDFKKLKSIARKTKCKIKVKSKKGLYFTFFKYRKRRVAFLLLSAFLIVSILSTTFIWDISITGNTSLNEETIIAALKESGVYIGKNKLVIENKKVINSMRVLISDISWIGIEVDGTTAYIEIVEKTKLPKDAIKENSIGDIIANKSGIIEKIVVENGTPILNVGDYVEEQRILIEGKIYSNSLGVKEVTANGIIIVKNEYVYEKEYSFIVEEKEYIEKNKYSVGFTINNNENYINYLNKSLKYDISREDKGFRLFGNEMAFSIYKFNIYELKKKEYSIDEIIELSKEHGNEYINNLMKEIIKNGYIVYEDIQTEVYEDYVKIKNIYGVMEEIGYFRERN